jgi:hypothetical protein
MKPRILGRHVNLLIFSDDFNVPIDLGELDEFSATSTTEIIKTRPVGYKLQGVTMKYGGYDLSFKIGKTNPMLERFNYLTEKNLLKFNQQPKLYILETATHYGGIIENWVYKNVTIYGLNKTINGQGDYEQDIKGFAQYKDLGPIDLTTISPFALGIGVQEFVFRANKPDVNALIQDVASRIGLG